ncbi:hypothetical protein KP509_28G044200 [Ceratopteris richardii]|uniref:C2 domain-containing protein n=1 Tax=Ceratopteris richardii TaxID=49495 RepID=A0A8T2RBK0_CERRI|nr:hypothetical protein KP509_28G044200 [Ceratopteris richardii]
MDKIIQHALDILVPSYQEVTVSLITAIVVVGLYCYSQYENSRKHGENAPSSSAHLLQNAKGPDQTTVLQGVGNLDWRSSYVYVIKLELLAAKNLIGANLNGTSDPYAIMTCGSQKRFSSLVQGSRNPMWGEEFDFFIEKLPTQISLAIYDWDIIRSSTILGSMMLEIKEEGNTDPLWYTLDSTGQVCLRTGTKCYPVSASGLDGLAGAIARRKLAEKPVATEVRTKPGPLQTIFDFPPDEVVEHSYSCAMERSFLYHGRMYVSTSKICFHSNVFAKQMKVVLPFEDIVEINRSQHAFINPAITIILRPGTGGHGVPPLASPDGRAKYKFASFWNRNHACRTLQRSAAKFKELEVQARQEQQQSDLRAHSSSFNEDASAAKLSNAEYALGEDDEIGQPFIKEDVLVEILEEKLSCTAEDFFKYFLSDESTFTHQYRAERKDYDLKVELWHTADQYSGILRKITMRSVCSSPMCPPDTALTELQHAVFRSNRQILVLETVQQAHDVPFGSYFEIHARWTVTTTADCSCTVNVKVGAHFNKWLPMQQKIKAGAAVECTKDATLIIRLAREIISENTVTSNIQENGCAPVDEKEDIEGTSPLNVIKIVPQCQQERGDRAIPVA